MYRATAGLQDEDEMQSSNVSGSKPRPASPLPSAPFRVVDERNESKSAEGMSSNGRGMLLVILAGITIRLLLACTGLPDYLVHRNELVTPLTSWTRREYCMKTFCSSVG